MLNKVLITFALLLVFPFSLVYAQNISMALKASTLGIGLEAQKLSQIHLVEESGLIILPMTMTEQKSILITIMILPY